nr:hypothetical protein [Tanacetum cinerariifolium]
MPLNLGVDEAVNQEERDRVEGAITTDASLEAAQDSDNITKTHTTAMSNVDIPQGIDTSGRPRRQETMGELAKEEARQEQERYNLEKALELQRQLDQRKENVSKDREDLETLWKLVKDKYGNNRPEEGFKNLHIFLLVDKVYPLTPATIKMMLERKLQAD